MRTKNVDIGEELSLLADLPYSIDLGFQFSAHKESYGLG